METLLIWSNVSNIYGPQNLEVCFNSKGVKYEVKTLGGIVKELRLYDRVSHKKGEHGCRCSKLEIKWKFILHPCY